MFEDNHINVMGARMHNLKDISVKIPRERLVVITGISGSGKSSLIFDTIYAEGQRRYMETFGAYARQFMGIVERPDVEAIEGLSPVIAIEQKTTAKNPRSTVGTMTEIYDFLRLLYARIGTAYSYKTGLPMIAYPKEAIIEKVLSEYQGQKVMILAPVVVARKGHYKELFLSIAKKGFTKVCVDGVITELTKGLQLDRYKTHDIEIVIDTLVIDEKSNNRITKSIETALKHGEGVLQIQILGAEEVAYFSRHLRCPRSGISYPKPAPNTFSFNSPKGSCPTCNGLGYLTTVSVDKIIPNKSVSIANGGIQPLGILKKTWIFNQLATIAKAYGFDLDTPIDQIPKKAMEVILYGSKQKIAVYSAVGGFTKEYHINFEGIKKFMESQVFSDSKSIKRWAHHYTLEQTCEDCQGKRIHKIARHFKIDGKDIADLTAMNLQAFQQWIQALPQKLTKVQRQIGEEVCKEIQERTHFLCEVGLGYLSLNRTTRSLSGGEAQRIRLATQIGSALVGVLYVLDEPSIGLHQRDNQRLIDSLCKLRDLGNSVLVVEHDKDMMLAADFLLDIGPKAGIHGGEIVTACDAKSLSKQRTLTTDYLYGRESIPIPKRRRAGNGVQLVLKGAKGNNLKNITVAFPLAKMIVVTGVSGSGKSTLISQTLYPILNQHFFRAVQEPASYEKIAGLEHIDKVIAIDQQPIGRTPRSNPATYTKVWDLIRELFAQTTEAMIRGYQKGRFSFNVKGGRCHHCDGGGYRQIEMELLPNVAVLCESCRGQRFNNETLQVYYKGKNIADVLAMTIEEALDFFTPIPKIKRKLKTLFDVGLGYLTLGQSSTTISGGEAQRLKLASELAKRSTGKTFYILDEPTTGLHFEDIKVLMQVLNKLVDKGNTVLIVEHQMDVIKCADWIIDIGLEGGDGGGEVVASGTPEMVAKNAKSHTGRFLEGEL